MVLAKYALLRAKINCAERLLCYCRTTSASTAPRTPRRTCCPYGFLRNCAEWVSAQLCRNPSRESRLSTLGSASRESTDYSQKQVVRAECALRCAYSVFKNGTENIEVFFGWGKSDLHQNTSELEHVIYVVRTKCALLPRNPSRESRLSTLENLQSQLLMGATAYSTAQVVRAKCALLPKIVLIRRALR